MAPRPTKAVKCRLSEDDHARLVAKARRHRVSVNTYLASLVLDDVADEPLPPDVPAGQMSLEDAHE